MTKAETVSHLRVIEGARTARGPSRIVGSGAPRTHMRSVIDFARGREEQPVKRVEPEAQGWLFPNTTLMGVVDMSGARGTAIEALLRTVRPRWLMDLRTLPLFDYDTMTRRRFFGLCQRLHIIYRDVSGLAEISSRRDASLSSGTIAPLINELLAEHPARGAPGPILFFLENSERAAVAEQVLPLLVEPRPKEGWTVCTYVLQ